MPETAPSCSLEPRGASYGGGSPRKSVRDQRRVGGRIKLE